ncbi:EAL domain-containing protein [Pseudanabaena biceps]|nr:EAL domain-containing protein [Pseudanabaena biceps]
MSKPSILVVDDEPNNFEVIEAILDNQDYQLNYAASGQDAIAFLDVLKPDLILLDVMMPVMDGLETCQKIKAMPQWSAVPIIMVTALTTKEVLAQALFAGADDFISKPINRLELTARVRSMLRIHQQYQQLATFNTQLEEKVKERTAQLQRVILEDALTKLPSRTFLLQELKERLQMGESSLALVYLDCDQFKLINGSFGHEVGDQLLIAIAQRLQQQNRVKDVLGVLARMEGDAFCFLLQRIEAETLELFLQEIIQSFNQPFTVANCEIFITVCIGIALSRDRDRNADELLQDADTAMYQAKLRGKNNHQIFDPQMHLTMYDRLILENDLQRAIEKQEFMLFYQPIVELQTQKLVGFEALVRWQHPERGLVSPAEFIPILEISGLIVLVGMLVFKQACQQIQAWAQQGWTELTMSVNLSVRQFACTTLLADIDHILTETDANPANIKLEITESAIMDNAETAIAITEELRSRQMQISIDDFGTGYSSLGYLQRFPVDNLKIDHSFVSQIQTEDRNPVVETIIALSNQLGLTVIAEGIETKEQLTWLQNVGCKYGQGYLFNRPLPVSEIERIYLKS